MYYRRKILLALIQLFNGELEKIRLQKLLFMYSRKKTNSEYDFIPYRFGCFSYSANADLTVMARTGLISESETHFKCLDTTDYLKAIKEADKTILLSIKSQFGKMNSHDLMYHTYVYYPYWATKSVKAENILSPNEFERVKNAIPPSQGAVLYTIGYEGISLEEYLNRLLINNVNVLVDVRRNSLSMKYGFSKSQLKKCCESIGIEYVHYPDLGIESELRQELNNQSDYDKLFESYNQNLKNKSDNQQELIKLLENNKSIALTCFEANINQCHRKHLAEAIQRLSGFNFEIKHI
jgi:uncharacterized protein (DUF488 family)